MTVLLAKLARTCPSCNANQYPYTHPRRGTRIRSTCVPQQCRIERAYAFHAIRQAASPMPEQLPLDDSGTHRENTTRSVA